MGYQEARPRKDDMIGLVALIFEGMKKLVPRQWAKWRWLALLTISLAGYCGFAEQPAAIAENTAPTSEAEQQPAPPAGPAATIDGFRQALFGMSE